MAEGQEDKAQSGGILNNPKSLPFFAHFNELRKRLTSYIIVLVALSFLFYWEPIHLAIMNIFFRDVIPRIPDGQFALMGMFDAMTFRFTVGVYGALIVTSPFLLYQIFAFFAPAMKGKERKWVFPTVLAAGGLFVTGVLFAYFLIMPMTIEFLLGQHTAYTFEVPRAQDWLSGVALVLIAFGISFELPLVIFALIGLGIVGYPTIRESWRVAYVSLFIFAAIITPDRGPVTTLALGLSLLILYESGLIASRFLLANRVDQQYIEAYEQMLLYDNAPTNDKDKLAKRAKLKKQAEAATARIKAREARKATEDSTEQESSEGE
ncbi:MAG: twin-arginine translocase subunit TatC [Coriobacteriia bacterium]|nr:twin-arginine translocase subunit TatC [Coriobacteriia bacterium]MCL2746384.1 twin-arginine translocase subunit TatC [Coriobacteriia bacterium]MCL2870158.1 twin-arginine translocase subunit TatC [Coriobacteriia bacterium]